MIDPTLEEPSNPSLPISPLSTLTINPPCLAPKLPGHPSFAPYFFSFEFLKKDRLRIKTDILKMVIGNPL